MNRKPNVKIQEQFTGFPGDDRSALILHVPHAGLHIPQDARQSIVLSDADLACEATIMADTNTNILALGAYEKSAFRPHVFVNNLSRLVIDPERFLDDSEEMTQVGMGAVYNQTHVGSILRSNDIDIDNDYLINQYFAPYAQAFSDLVTDVFNRFGHVTIIDVHSYATSALPYELHAHDIRPALCIGTDNFHTKPALRDKVASVFSDFGTISTNQPFSGTYVPLEYYGVEARVQSVMLEFRKDSYAAGEPASQSFKQTESLLAGLIDDLNRHAE